MALIKFASRRTVARMCRSEVEERIERMGIELAPISTSLPVWWNDGYDPFMLEDGIDEQTWNAQHTSRQEQWQATQDSDPEHPQAREALFQETLRRAVRRAGLAELNKIITRTLRDKEKVPAGCQFFSTWQARTATRLEREKAVIQVLSAEDRDEK